MDKSKVITAISVLIFLSKASSTDTLKPGEKLNSSLQLISANGVFTLEFYSPPTSQKGYLAILHTRREFNYPVWIANRNSPITDKNSGILTISSLGKLMIMHDGGDPIELYSDKTASNITATLLDNGNLVVKEMNSDGEVLWQSFDYPTDTLLPGMKLGVDHRTGRNWTLTSWLAWSNPASGAFMLEWDWIRRRLLVRRRGVVYWTSGDLKAYKEDGNTTIYAFEHIVPAYNVTNYVYRNVSNQDEAYFAYYLPAGSDSKAFHRWNVDFTGIFIDSDRTYLARGDLCDGYSESSVGCELWAQPKCRNSHQAFAPSIGYFQDGVRLDSENKSTLGLSDCKDTCWNDCQCVGYSADDDVGCTYWRGNAVFIQDDDRIHRASRRLYVLSEPSKKRKRNKLIIITAPVVPVVAALLLALLYFLVQKLKQVKRRKKRQLQEFMILEDCTSETFELEQFSYASILASTNNFSTDNKLGEGGFGAVYKGQMPQGHEMAVKLLSHGSGQGLLEFKTELVLMSKLQHRNLVKLLGFCIHENGKIILYEYLPNKSLDLFIFDPAKRKQLNWELRFNIIKGIAQGLLYLHKYARLLIIHRDLKASNILLDENMNPKISDFGLARIFKPNPSGDNSNKLAGTYGYMAPEYVHKGIFSIKSDIYSFGVVMLEIVSGRRNNSFHNLDGPQSLVQYAWELWKRSAELELVDPALRGASVNVKDEVRRCIHVGLLCVQNRAADRPPVEDVISMLEKEIEHFAMPEKPAFVAGDDVVPELQILDLNKPSQNEISLSLVNGR